ncbi:MAG: cell wall hydrolase, partial [Oscillibacter sp.]|nr:cell wall hydrolase [Oscillibacter sp.]
DLNLAAFVESGVTYVPLRAFLNALGGWEIAWDAERREAVAASAFHTLRADPAGDLLTLDGVPYSGQVAVEAGVTTVPLRLLVEALGGKVAWDAYLGGAAVTSPGAEFDAADLYWLSRIIYAESGAEPFEGQVAVGNVVLNRLRCNDFPNTIPAVIFDAAGGVQFEPTALGTVYQTPSEAAVEAAKRALRGENAVGAAMFFYAPALSEGAWINENCEYRRTIGGHRFYDARI